MDKSEKISGALGLALTLIPWGMQEVGVHFPIHFYWGIIVVGAACLIYAMYGMTKFVILSSSKIIRFLNLWSMKQGAIAKEPVCTHLAKKKMVHEIWEKLNPQDKDIVKEIFFKRRVSDKDIMRILRDRGLLHYEGTYSPLASRVSFIRRDYVGYNSIPSEFLPFIIEELIAEKEKTDNSEIEMKMGEYTPDWRSQAPIIVFQDSFHKRIDAKNKNGEYIGQKVVFYIEVKRQRTTPLTDIACKLMRIQFVSPSPGVDDYVYPQMGDIVLDHAERLTVLGTIELSERCPTQTFYVVSKLEGSDKIKIEGFGQNDETTEFPWRDNKFRFRIGVTWSGKTFPIKEYLVWVTHEGQLKMEFEADI